MNSEVDEDFVKHLRSLVFVCAGGSALEWKQLWQHWRYSDCVEYALQKIGRVKEDFDEITSAEIELPEGYIVMLLQKILQRL
ncbi:MAG: hypothetical protein AB1728_13245 [Bacteroidota bacterium]